MTRRKQNLISFFRENEECNLISSRLVRLYMNRFTIDEDDETEVTQVHNVKNGTREEYEECFSKSLKIARENETPRTDYHFIIGYSTVNDDKKSWYAKMKSFFRWSETDSLIYKFSQLIANNQSRLENCYAVTLLHGSNSLKFSSENDKKVAYQYQKQDDKYEKDDKENFLRKIFNGMNFVTERFERSINDDLEWFHRRILDSGMSNANRINERIQTFHFEILDDNQVKNLKNSMDKHKDYYARFNCIRVTMYSNSEAMENLIFLLVEIFHYQLSFYIIKSFFGSESALVIIILWLLMFYHDNRSYFSFVSHLIIQFVFFSCFLQMVKTII